MRSFVMISSLHQAWPSPKWFFHKTYRWYIAGLFISIVLSDVDTETVKPATSPQVSFSFLFNHSIQGIMKNKNEKK